MRAKLQESNVFSSIGKVGFGLLALLGALLVSLGLPPSALAKVYLSDGGGISQPAGGLEGDPLDSNDSGSSGGDIVHERRELPEGDGVTLVPGITGLVLYRIVPVVEDGQVRFIIIISPVEKLEPEAVYVR